jgi:hypothetical protein
MAYGTLNVDTVTTSTTGGVLGAGNASIMKNRIINGAMVIDQRNAGASVTPTDGQYTLDRFGCRQTTASKFSIQQNAGSVTPPVGFTNYLGVTSLSAYSVPTGDIFQIAQNIEGFNIADLAWGTANAKTVTLSFQVYSSLTGTFGGALSNGANNRSYPFSYTVSSANTWTSISVTIAGDTTGTWLTTNGIGIQVKIGLGVGSTYSATAGAWTAGGYNSATGATSVVGTSGATFYITGVQLEVGSSATGYEYRQYQQELALCQRYYETSYDVGTVAGTAQTTGQWIGTILPASTATALGNGSFKVIKRATATVNVYANNGTSGSVTFPSISAAIAISSLTAVTSVGFPQINFSAGQTSGSIACCSWTASAEL